ncbi:Alpha/Beta hydrolase protein [Lipomyces oligophaga]|uniref:Alpha/Beta hydrolase protein n=1 Tax=Lipomyces oligophaga TaxID=45792 RepID=UPI0034CFEFF9
MQTALLPSGVCLAYYDSGTPSVPIYDTIIFCHGVSYNGNAFTPLFPFADSLGVRLISYNQRGYAHSTSLTDAQAALSPGDSLAQTFLFVQDLLDFIDYILSTLSLPRKPIILGWSKGTYLTLAIAAPDYLPRNQRAAVLSKISCIVLYEPPGSAFGIPLTKDYLAAMGSSLKSSDNSLLAAKFAEWVSGVYEPGSDEPSSILHHTLSSEFLEKTSEPHMVRHGFYWGLAPNPVSQSSFTLSALTQTDVPIGVCRNGKTAGYLVAAFDEARKMGCKHVKVLDDEGNHFAFITHPQQWLTQISEFVKEILT